MLMLGLLAGSFIVISHAKAEMPVERYAIHCPIYNHELVLSPGIAELMIEASGDQLIRTMSHVQNSCRPTPGVHGAQWCDALSTLHILESEHGTDIDWDLKVNFKTSTAELVELNNRKHYRSAPRICRVKAH